MVSGIARSRWVRKKEVFTLQKVMMTIKLEMHSYTVVAQPVRGVEIPGDFTNQAWNLKVRVKEASRSQ